MEHVDSQSLEDQLKLRLENLKNDLVKAEALVEKLKLEISKTQQSLELHQFSNDVEKGGYL